MQRLLHRSCLPALTLGSFLIATAQQPSALPPSIDPAIWGCANHPYAAVMEVDGAPVRQENQAGQNKTRQVKVDRDAAGNLRTETFYDNGLPMVVMLKSPTTPIVIELKVVEKAAFRLPEPFPDRSRAGETWTVSSLPARKIMGIDTVGLRYVRKVHSEANTPGTSATIVEDDWVAPSACMVLERHVTNPLRGSQYERVVRLEQREPDPKLFEVPQGYAFMDSVRH